MKHTGSAPIAEWDQHCVLWCAIWVPALICVWTPRLNALLYGPKIPLAGTDALVDHRLQPLLNGTRRAAVITTDRTLFHVLDPVSVLL